MLGLPPFNPEGIRKDLCKLGALKLKLYLFHTHMPSGLTWLLILESETAGNSVSRRLPLPQEEITGVL